ncbi:hypothetical protein ROS62_08280 [Streptomyces sp. DSM 41972]|uniref:Uncharacterized protein n=1 Tax=Streptomyces althioticus subsp. attaecolombicae TaxID=3075534 RepID=A0ABU3HYH1_9ACTN|nr:hypothetical protein [Streptomyces sp. DSM 41972]SCD67649.1 hypothetical protein GA0115238_120083 [Streptomyces sp. di50b]SCD75839.1 hypothetical protein GA0115245_112582 [Streptomyces sp. di188]
MEPTARPRSAALLPVEGGRDVRVHLGAHRRLASEHWLLSTLPEYDRARARQEWTDHRIALLPMGTLVSAVRLPARLVLAVAGCRGVCGEVDRFLAEALEGGPVICDPNGRRFYALVPASMPATWRAAAEEWQSAEVECLGRNSYLGVPRLDVTEPDVRVGSYWSVPMSSAASLCGPLAVARLIAAGWHEVRGRGDCEEA